MTDRYRPVSETVLSDAWGTLTRHEFDFRRADGTWQRQRREVYDRGNGCAALLHDPEADTVLLVRQFRLPVLLDGMEPFLLEAPAGLLEGAEPEARMRDELREETGYEARTLERVADLVMSPGSVKEHLALYLGTYERDGPRDAGGGAEGEGEDIEVVHMPFAEAVEGVLSGRIADAKTVALIGYLALRRAR